MQFKWKKAVASCLTMAALMATLTGCGGDAQTTGQYGNDNIALAAPLEQSTAAPKYVFLFIGDGMSYPQFQACLLYTSRCV